jgi:hypothetical protein
MYEERTVTIYLWDWLETIEDRLRFWDYDRKMPEFVADYFREFLEEIGPELPPQHTDPKFIVDNFIVNGSYGESAEYRNHGESDEDFWARMEDEAIMCWPERDYVLMCWGF